MVWGIWCPRRRLQKEKLGKTNSRPLPSGDPAANVAISQQRADAVRNVLIHAGVDSSMLVAKGYGSANPIASNDLWKAASATAASSTTSSSPDRQRVFAYTVPGYPGSIICANGVKKWEEANDNDQHSDGLGNSPRVSSLLG
jgi:hypothetical protein